MMKVYISTGGSNKISAFDFCKLYGNAGIDKFELSGGEYVQNVRECLIKFSESFDLQLHNYFPPPENPFVINLASSNIEIVKRSLEHIYRCIDYTNLIKKKYYSFHGGFLIDPDFSQLGKSIDFSKISDRNEAIERFICNVNILAEYANQKNVKLLIENNVLSVQNVKKFNSNPLLMVDSSECALIMKETPNNVGLLVDLAHLNVSSNTMGFKKCDFVEQLQGWTYAYHVSDNDGCSDTNHPVTRNSWFWPLIDPNVEYLTIEVYGVEPDVMFEQYSLARDIIDAKNF